MASSTEDRKVAAALTRLVLNYGTECRKLYTEEFGGPPVRDQVGNWDSTAWESRCAELRDLVSDWAAESEDHDENDLWEAFQFALFDDFEEEEGAA